MENKLKIMKTKPEISGEEIRAYMDFDELLKKQKNLLNARRKAALIHKIAAISFMIIVLSVVWYHTQQEEDVSELTNSSEEISEPQNEEEILPEDSHQFDEQPNQINKTESISTVPENSSEKKVGEGAADSPVKTNEESLQEPVDPDEASSGSRDYEFKEAVPIDGYPVLYEYFSRALHYPEEGLKDSIQGVVTVTFIINEAGSPEKIQIENSLGEAFDRETKKMIENMPRWNPATVNGKPIASRLAIPLTFQIEKIK